MSLAPGSHHQDVWHDVNRMLTLNGAQKSKNLQMHVCPLQFDIVDRLIERYSNKDDLIFDPFGGLQTVPYRALKMGRKGRASELNTSYFMDGVKYLVAAEKEMSMPSLFDFQD
jgi:DNA modification methylase